jgi:hypothetical protein
MQENRTAGIAADRLREAGYDVTTGVGKTGVVGILRNGDGSTIMLRADFLDCRQWPRPALSNGNILVRGHGGDTFGSFLLFFVFHPVHPHPCVSFGSG